MFLPIKMKGCFLSGISTSNAKIIIKEIQIHQSENENNDGEVMGRRIHQLLDKEKEDRFAPVPKNKTKEKGYKE